MTRTKAAKEWEPLVSLLDEAGHLSVIHEEDKEEREDGEEEEHEEQEEEEGEEEGTVMSFF